MDVDYLGELFSRFRPVAVRRMFGGAGLVADGVTFGIVFDGVIYLRADEALAAAFKATGSAPFVYPYAKHPRRRRNPDAAPFWRMPEHLYDDPDEAARWAERSFAVAQAKQTQKRKRPGVSRAPAAPRAANVESERVARRRRNKPPIEAS